MSKETCTYEIHYPLVGSSGAKVGSIIYFILVMRWIRFFKNSFSNLLSSRQCKCNDEQVDIYTKIRSGFGVGSYWSYLGIFSTISHRYQENISFCTYTCLFLGSCSNLHFGNENAYRRCIQVGIIFLLCFDYFR